MFYKVLDSAACNDNPLNSPLDFRTNLIEELDLQGNWGVALCDITFYKKAGKSLPSTLYVCTNIVEEYQVGKEQLPLLRRIHAIGNKQKGIFHIDYSDRYYIKVDKDFVRDISIVIKDKDYPPVAHTNISQPMQEGALLQTVVTLHFKIV